MKWRLIFIIFLCFILYTLYFMPVSVVHAASEFSSSYDFTYEVLENGLTKVTQQISLTNLTTNYYASEYSLTVGTDEISNVLGGDNLGPLRTKVTFQNGTTLIHVFFNEKVLGMGKILKWQLTYNSTAIAKHEGRIWKINLPKAFKDENFTSYNIKLVVPVVFGQPSYLNPKPKINYLWTKEEKAQEGISLAFGDWQDYEFTITYNLRNPHFVPEIREIVLPQTTPSQEIILKKNWPTRYFLWPKQNLKIKIEGYAKVFTYPFLIQNTTGQIKTNFISEIPLKKETPKPGFWQKIWENFFSKP